ncbi:MAG: iron-sulfur cluster assembly accessory protein [Betaproteobacteria bacterium]|nr:iron-sulfur cluster assembly accessory protein [Betaproteobacteria bacterium]
MNITITPRAEQFMRRIVRFGGPEGAGFRLSVSPGGCSGLSSVFSAEAAPLPGDAVFDRDGLRLFLPAESRLLLEGATIDFVDTMTESGLSFILPHGGSCGCSSASAGASDGRAVVDISAIRRA